MGVRGSPDVEDGRKSESECWIRVVPMIVLKPVAGVRTGARTVTVFAASMKLNIGDCERVGARALWEKERVWRGGRVKRAGGRRRQARL